ATIDLLYLIVIVCLTAWLLARVPTKWLELLWVAVVLVALFFAGSSLVMDTVTQGQGRLVAFGGGPNVFVRIVALGCIGVVALAIVRSASQWMFLLLLVPLLGVAGILSGSRGGVLGLGVSAMMLGVMALAAGQKRARRDIAIGLVVVGGGFALWGWDRVAPYV